MVGTAASGTFAARCPATLCMPSTGHAKSGTPGRTRTCNMRFWRPPLYHLSYRSIKAALGLEPASNISADTRSKLRSGGHMALKKPRVCGLGALLTHILRARNGALRIPALLLWKNACDIEKKKPERRCCRWGDGPHASGSCGYSCPALRCETEDLHLVGRTQSAMMSHIEAARETPGWENLYLRTAQEKAENVSETAWKRRAQSAESLVIILSYYTGF